MIVSDEPCIKTIDCQEATNFFLSISALSTSVRSAFICGMLTTCRQEGATRISTDRHLNRVHANQTFCYYRILGKRVCRNYFFTICGITPKIATRLNNLSRKMFTSDAMDFDEKRGGAHASSHKIDGDRTDDVLKFLDNYSEMYALPDPGRNPNSDYYGIKLQLPYSCTYQSVYDEYVKQCEDPVSINSFRNIWKISRPYILRLSKRSDMCTICGRFHNLIAAKLRKMPEEYGGNNETPDDLITQFKTHRENAHLSRKFYYDCRKKAIEAWKNKSVSNGITTVNYSVISVDFAQSYPIPNHSDQLGDMYFESPPTCGFFGITEEGMNEQRCYLLREEHSFSKCGSSVGSMIYDYLDTTNINREQIHIFADNTCSQNKNQFLFALLSYITICKLFGCKKVRLSFMCVGHTKFAPDAWFGLLKAFLARMDINCVLDIEQAVIECTFREGAGFLGMDNRPHVPKFTHNPFDNSINCVSFNLNELHDKFFFSKVGQTQYFDIIFNEDGSYLWKTSPCGDYEDASMNYWNHELFVRNIELLKSFDIFSLSQCPENIMDDERKNYIESKIRKFISLGSKTYSQHVSKGNISFRSITCPNGDKNSDEDLDYLTCKLRICLLSVFYRRKQNFSSLI